MPRLRNILMTHEIPYPASAKKADLVTIFDQKLKPQARKLLAARDRVRRTSEGITHVPSSQDSSVDGKSDSRSSMAPPPIPDTPRYRKPRKNNRVSSDGTASASESRDSTPGGDEARLSTLDSQTPKQSQSSPSQHRANLGRSRPQMPESAFSNENPFQSGSSPLIEANRRKTAGSSGERRKTSSSRRRTEGVSNPRVKQEQTDGIVVPTSRTFEIPVSRLKAESEEDPSGVEAGEDFTPEEQLELVRDRARNGESDILPPRRVRKSKTSSNVPKSLPWMFLTALLGGFATWYRQEKLAVGYCEVGRSSDALTPINIPEWASDLQPTCEPCPQHAFCFENLGTECEEGFILRSHPLSLSGLVPLPPSCDPDGEKARKIKAVADRAVEELRKRNAEAECGTLKDSDGKAQSPEIAEQDLKNRVGEKRRRGMTEAEFEDLWKGAIGEIIGREEVVQGKESPDGTRLASTSLSRLPFVCSVRRSARLTLARYRVPLSVVALITFIVLYIRNKIRQRRADAARVPSLVATTLDRLATQAALYSRGDSIESWISVGQLRDDVLRDEFSEKRRENVWKKVRAVVEGNANVRASSRELRGGDVSRVWEWIGSIGLIDDPGFLGRKSGGKRVSWGEVVEEDGKPEGRLSPPAEDGVPEGKGKAMEQRRWDEGRPIY
ncbi:uncharacterized protein KY384_002536 [Bacidia gigantensis]|uniref:uncharacterized protein n=1 Tax=Bacidia gigantensis TaxID=2732470 RepID=UPI001D05B42F|nr:uncharacterized protein KY384_002536 [Bacidia gigantensis]KAG8532659.1 hypothetical protein KY384_002536 [Bacidia gigantensis]